MDNHKLTVGYHCIGSHAKCKSRYRPTSSLTNANL